MSFYNDAESVKSYIQMCEGYDGSNIYQALHQHLPENSTLLELGSGPGLDIKYLKNIYSVTGSDLSEEFLKICKEQHPEISFLKLNALKLDLGEKFGCIYSNKVLHHLTEEELKESLEQQVKILSPKLRNNWMITVFDYVDEKREKEFNDWLESIVFVDKDGRPLPVILTDDESDDPEGDRE